MKVLLGLLAILLGKYLGAMHLISLLQIFLFDIPLTIKLCRARIYAPNKSALISSIFVSIFMHSLIWLAGLWVAVFLKQWCLYIGATIVFGAYILIKGKQLHKHILLSLYVQKHANSLNRHFLMLVQGPYDNIQNPEDVLDLINLYSRF